MLRDNLAGLIEPMLSSAGTYSLALHPNQSSDDRPQNALKIPARQGGIYTLPENVASPFHAEPNLETAVEYLLRLRRLGPFPNGPQAPT